MLWCFEAVPTRRRRRASALCRRRVRYKETMADEPVIDLDERPELPGNDLFADIGERFIEPEVARRREEGAMRPTSWSRATEGSQNAPRRS
jgi:hypothetical protein